MWKKPYRVRASSAFAPVNASGIQNWTSSPRRARVAIVAALEEGEPARHDADDRVALARPSQPHILPEHVRVAAVEALPQAVAQDDLSLRGRSGRRHR